MTREETDWVNQHVDLIALVQEYYGVELVPGFTSICPFHRDTRKSAKTFPDNCMYCFTERKSYRPYNVLQVQGLTDDAIRSRYNIPRDLKPREAWSPPPEYQQALVQLRQEQRTVEEIMRVWEYMISLIDASRAGEQQHVKST